MKQNMGYYIRGSFGLFLNNRSHLWEKGSLYYILKCVTKNILGGYLSKKVLDVTGDYSASEYLLAEYSLANIRYNAHFLYFYFQGTNGNNQVFKMGMLHIGEKVIREDTQISISNAASIQLRFDISNEILKIYAKYATYMVMYRMS